MYNKLLIAASAVALVGAAPAHADMNTDKKADVHIDVEAKTDTKTSTEPGSAKAAAQSTGDFSKDVEKAWKDIKRDTSEAYKDIKATVVGKTEGEFTPVTIDERMTATGMIGRSVYNATGEDIATVKDIILDRDGKAIMVVVADGEFIGMGKTAAFDYDVVARVDSDGDFIMPLTEAMIDNSAEFSYDRDDYSDDVRVVPSNGYSVAELLDGQLVNQAKETIGQIDNISFQNGHASQLIVGFNQTLGLGGEKAALNYDASEVIPDGDGYDFQLSAEQAAQFETYKKTSTN